MNEEGEAERRERLTEGRGEVYSSLAALEFLYNVFLSNQIKSYISTGDKAGPALRACSRAGPFFVPFLSHFELYFANPPLTENK